jgi:hypothetical protein
MAPFHFMVSVQQSDSFNRVAKFPFLPEIPIGSFLGIRRE